MAAILSLPIHSSVFSFCCLASLWNCSSFIASLYCSLNLLFNISNIPSSYNMFPALLCIRVSESCRSCLACQFFTIDTLFVWLILKFWSMFFASSLKFLNLAYLSLELQSNIGCFMMAHLFLVPCFLFLLHQLQTWSVLLS